MNYILETCADSVQSAIEAKKGGANRIELCSNLVIGGTSPGESLFRQVKEQTGLNVRVLLRPRFGDFCYDNYEFRMILDEVRMFRKLGADGIVIGILNPDGTLNMEQMKALVEEAGTWELRCTVPLMFAGILMRQWSSVFHWGLIRSLQADRKALPGRDVI